MQKIVLYFKDMCCEWCVKIIFWQLHSIIGIDEVTLDFNSREAVVMANPKLRLADLFEVLPSTKVVTA